MYLLCCSQGQGLLHCVDGILRRMGHDIGIGNQLGLDGATPHASVLRSRTPHTIAEEA